MVISISACCTLRFMELCEFWSLNQNYWPISWITCKLKSIAWLVFRFLIHAKPFHEMTMEISKRVVKNCYADIHVFACVRTMTILLRVNSSVISEIVIMRGCISLQRKLADRVSSILRYSSSKIIVFFYIILIWQSLHGYFN